MVKLRMIAREMLAHLVIMVAKKVGYSPQEFKREFLD